MYSSVVQLCLCHFKFDAVCSICWLRNNVLIIGHNCTVLSLEVVKHILWIMINSATAVDLTGDCLFTEKFLQNSADKYFC